MTISHVQPLLLLLLASLFLLPALRAFEVPFEDCGHGSSLVPVSSVHFIPNLLNPFYGSVIISGYTSKTITEGKMKLGAQGTQLVDKTYDVCELVACPVAPGAIMFFLNKAFPIVLGWKFQVSISYVPESPKVMCVKFQYELNVPVVASISA